MSFISINQAAAAGIERLRRPEWVQPEDHLKLDIIAGGRAGPWTHLYAPFNEECNGRDPVSTLCLVVDYNEVAWLPYSGPLPDSPEYKAAQAYFAGCLKKT